MATVRAESPVEEVFYGINAIFLATPWTIYTDNGYQAAVIDTKTVATASFGTTS